jgi:phosphohistidine phosphatase
MKVYFLRHGEADWPEWDRPDDERPLTQKGKKELKRVADFLADHDVNPAILLSSPLPRAYQTAEVVAERLNLQVSEEPALAPGFDPKKLAALLKQHAGQDVMLVGHEPSFSGAIAALTGGSVRLAKAAVARVDVDDPHQLRGQLIWLITPKLVK